MSETINKIITTESGLIDFRFEPIIHRGETIFLAVYCRYKAADHRFYLMQDENTEFVIVDKHNCPEELYSLEQSFSDFIYSTEM